MGGNWGRNTFSVQDPPQEYFNFLDSINTNWVGISVALHIENSMDSTVERVYSGVGIPTFKDEDLIRIIRAFKDRNFNVYLTLAFEAVEAEHAIHPVQRWQLGDPKMHIEDPNVHWAYWPWATDHPEHDSFVNKFFKTYTDQAVYYANICEQEGVGLYSIGTETNRLFRTRTGGYWPNNFLSHLNTLVDSVRQVYSGPLTYDMEYSALTNAGFFLLDSLWNDLDLDAVGISAYFPLIDTMPDTVMSIEKLKLSWNRIFNDYLVPLQNSDPDRPIYFLEFGYVDAIGSPHMPSIREFENKFIEDNNQNGIDDGEETQANIHEAFFQVNKNYSDLVKGAFLWGNQMASDVDWVNSFGQLRGFAVRNKTAENVVKQHYAQYTRTPDTPQLISPINDQSIITDTCALTWNSCMHATSYRIQLANDSLLTLELKDKHITDTLFIARDLIEDIPYFWRAKGVNRTIESDWSETRRFIRTNVAIQKPFPRIYVLEQNYPNPFNPKTVITLQNTVGCNSVINIYNTQGVLVDILFNDYIEAGYFTIIWDASDFPSGIYFYQLQAGDFIETKKMVLMK